MKPNVPFNILLNGSEHALSESIRLSDLLTGLQVQTRHVAVEVNEELIPRDEHDSHQLRPGDRVEIVTLVGGG